jgi:hypothetical protein
LTETAAKRLTPRVLEDCIRRGGAALLMRLYAGRKIPRRTVRISPFAERNRLICRDLDDDESFRVVANRYGLSVTTVVEIYNRS